MFCASQEIVHTVKQQLISVIVIFADFDAEIARCLHNKYSIANFNNWLI